MPYTPSNNVVIKKKIEGDIITLYPLTTSSLVKVGSNTLDTELNIIKNSILGSVPVGAVTIWFGTNYPDGWLPINGQEISRTKYADLFKIYGTTFGSGNGSTTFNLPNQNTSNNDDSEDIPQYFFIVKALAEIYSNSSTSTVQNIQTFNLNEEIGSPISTYDESNRDSILVSVPIGCILDYAGSIKLPDGYLLTDGSELKISEYRELYDTIGDIFSDDSTKDGYFKIPNMESMSDDTCKIIKAYGNNNILNVLNSSKTDVVNADVIAGLMKRIETLEQMLGI